MRTLIKNVSMITPYEILRGHALVIEDGYISYICKEDDSSLKDYDNVIDGGNNYLSPGFIDIHNHGNSGYDVMDSNSKAIDYMADYHLKNGVTSFLGTVITSSYENMKSAIENMANYENKKGKSNLIGIHLEGPFFAIEKKGAQPEEYIKLPDINKLESLLDVSKDKIKMVSLAPELKGSHQIIPYLKSKNIIIAMGHSNANYEEAKMGIYEGITIATHLYNGMRNFNHREPGIVGAALDDNRVYCELIFDTIHLHDASVAIALKMKGPEKIILVSDAMRAAGLNDGEYELGGQRVFVKDGTARLENGSLAGSVLDLRKAVQNMVFRMNIPVQQAVSMASLNPAKALKIDDKKGSLEVGKDADMVLFDSDINVLASIVGGDVVWIEN